MIKNIKVSAAIIIGLIILVFVSCKKNNYPGDELPPVTSSGANTFGCIFDGKVFAAKTKCKYRVGPNFYSPPCVDIDLDYDRLELDAKSEDFMDHQNTKISISAKSDTNFTQIQQIFYNSRITIERSGSYEYYRLDTTQQNELKILNKRAGDISGIFTLHFINTTGQKKVLKDGRFDVQF